MSLKKVDEVKKDKGFKIWDLLIYGAVLLIVAVTFTVVFTKNDNSPLTGITVTVHNEEVFKYSFENKEIDFIDKTCVSVLTDSDEILEVKIDINGEYNTLSINKYGYVKITEANCDRYHPDCVESPFLSCIKDNGGTIYCQPHDLLVKPYKFTPDNNVVL